MTARICCFGAGEDREIVVNGKRYRLDFNDRCGPLFLRRDGRVAVNQSLPRALRAVSLWQLQGMRMDRGTCVWHEPKQPVYQRRGGRLWLVAPGEKGHDWR